MAAGFLPMTFQGKVKKQRLNFTFIFLKIEMRQRLKEKKHDLVPLLVFFNHELQVKNHKVKVTAYLLKIEERS